MKTFYLWKKYQLYVYKKIRRKIHDCNLRKIGEFSQSRNDRDVMGSRARSYLRLEVVVGGGRRRAAEESAGKVNAVETWYSRDARQGGEGKRRWDYDEIRGEVAVASALPWGKFKNLSPPLLTSLSTSSRNCLNRKKKEEEKEDISEKYIRQFSVQCYYYNIDAWSIVIVRHNFFFSSIVVASIINMPRYFGEMLSWMLPTRQLYYAVYLQGALRRRNVCDLYFFFFFSLRHDLDRCRRKYRVRRRNHPRFRTASSARSRMLDAIVTRARARARDPSRVATPRRPAPRHVARFRGYYNSPGCEARANCVAWVWIWFIVRQRGWPRARRTSSRDVTRRKYSTGLIRQGTSPHMLERERNPCASRRFAPFRVALRPRRTVAESSAYVDAGSTFNRLV